MNIKILKSKQNPKLKTIYQLGMDLSVFDYEFWETISFEYPLIQFPPKLCPFLIYTVYSKHQNLDVSKNPVFDYSS